MVRLRAERRAVPSRGHEAARAGSGEEDFSLFFTDATTGKESYKVGRYLDAEPLPDGRYVLDFNRAYSPACAYSDHYNCPIPPRENRLDVAVRAGEMDPHTTH